jgi:hypothetical protein
MSKKEDSKEKVEPCEIVIDEQAIVLRRLEAVEEALLVLQDDVNELKDNCD